MKNTIKKIRTLLTLVLAATMAITAIPASAYVAAAERQIYTLTYGQQKLDYDNGKVVYTTDDGKEFCIILEDGCAYGDLYMNENQKVVWGVSEGCKLLWASYPIMKRNTVFKVWKGMKDSRTVTAYGLRCLGGTANVATHYVSGYEKDTSGKITGEILEPLPTFKELWYYWYGEEYTEETAAPATKTPATAVPETAAPATKTPATAVPATEAPATKTPATKAPTTEAPAPTDAIHADVDTHREIDGKVDWQENINGTVNWSEKDHTDISWDSKTDVNWNSKTDTSWNSQTDANINWQEKEHEKTDSQWTESNKEITKSVTDNTYDENNNLIHSETTTTTTGQKDGASTATKIGEEIGKAIINAVTSGNAVTNQTGNLQAEQNGKATVDTEKQGEATFEAHKDGDASFHVNDDSHTEVNVVVPSNAAIVLPGPNANSDADANANNNLAPNTATATSSAVSVYWHVKRKDKQVKLMRRKAGKTGQVCRVKFFKKKGIAKFDGTTYKKVKYVGYTAKSHQILLIKKNGKVWIVPRGKEKTGKTYTKKIINSRKWKKAIEDNAGLVIRVSDNKGHVKGVKKAQPKVVK